MRPVHASEIAGKAGRSSPSIHYCWRISSPLRYNYRTIVLLECIHGKAVIAMNADSNLAHSSTNIQFIMKTSRSEFITVRGLQYHVRHWGSEGAAKLFMVHGWMDVSAS